MCWSQAACGVRTLCNASVSSGQAQQGNRDSTSSSNSNRTESFNSEEEVGGGLQAWPMGRPGEFDYTVWHAPETLRGAGKICTCIGWKSARKEKVVYASE